MTKYMVMHKVDQVKHRDDVLPSVELLAAVGELVSGAREAGTFVDAAGLRSSAKRVRVRFRDGEAARTQGPYEGEHELVTGYAMLQVASMEAAVDWGTRLARALGDVELEVGAVTEPWDLGMMDKPQGVVPVRVLALPKAGRDYEAGIAQSAQVARAVTKVIDDMREAGVLISANRLAPSSRGARIKREAGRQKVMDGPFAESKELIGGFMILEFGSKSEAVQWAQRYAEAIDVDEVDVREVE